MNDLETTAVRFSIIVPVYHSAQTLETLHRRLVAVMEGIGESFEIILVDDASGDDSWAVIGTLADRDPRVRGIQLMRNSGQANATMAGMAEARGDLLITLDDDLQQPPEEIPKLIASLTADPDQDMVIGVPQEKHHPLWRNLASDLLNWLSRRMFGQQRSFKLTTFRLLRRRAVEPLLAMNLPDSALGALLQSITRRTGNVTVDHAPRSQGRSGYTLTKMVNLTVQKFLGFSTLPLRLLTLVGVAGVGLSLCLGIAYLASYLSGNIGLPGFTTLTLLLIFISGLNFLTLGVFGEYLQQILLASRRTPPFVVRDRVATDRVATDRVATDRVATDRVATDKIVKERSRAAPVRLPEPCETPETVLAYAKLARLAERFGTPFYFCNVDVFRRNFQNVAAVFGEIYPRTRLAVSYRRHTLPVLCRRVDEWGAVAQVASNLEYELALRLGVDPSHILLTGPYRHQRDLSRALVAGSVASLTADYELALVEAVAASHPGRILNVDLRLAFDAGMQAPVHRGFDADGDEIRQAVRRLEAAPGVRLVGLHGPPLLAGNQPDACAEIARKILSLVTEVFPDPSKRLVFLDGASSSRTLIQARRDPASEAPDGVKGCGEAVAERFAAAFPNGGGPELIVDPGSAILADVVQLVARVLDVRGIAARKVALVSASDCNALPAESRAELPFRRVPADPAGPPAESCPVDLVGDSCWGDGVLHRGYEGEIAAGDFVVFDNLELDSPVSRPLSAEPAPAVLAIEDGELWPERRARTLGDVFAPFELGGKRASGPDSESEEA